MTKDQAMKWAESIRSTPEKFESYIVVPMPEDSPAPWYYVGYLTAMKEIAEYSFQELADLVEYKWVHEAF